jgi:phosphoglycolate phosphatase-like HAD superfamily hydrolase
MLTDAIAKCGCTPEQTVFVGDSREDMQAAVGAAVTPILVETGRGRKEALSVSEDPELSEVRVVPDIGAAVRWVCEAVLRHPARWP